jgi:DNA/RNA endonuclease G (NUC1)
MRFRRARFVLLAALGASIASCTDGPVTPRLQSLTPRRAAADDEPTPVTKIVISQVYGGGGNSGAKYKNDFIELYNAGNTSVSLNGWSVQYASSTGSSWQVTTLAGNIAPGTYYLVREAAGAGGTDTLPTPNAVGTGSGIAMSASAGKVALVKSVTALGVACPLTPTRDPNVVDFVGFGSGANCFEGSGPTGTLSNTTAALRLDDGATDNDDNKTDFTVGAPNPRNGPCDGSCLPAGSGGTGGGTPSGVAVSIGAGSPLVIGYETGVFASGTDNSGHTVNSGNVTWSSSDTTILKVTDPRGIVRAVGPGSAHVIATAQDGTQGSFTLTTEVPIYNASARLGHNTEFGTPTDADPSNDVIITREQYTISYNPLRGGPNWVSWDLSATHLGSRNRCNCYSADTALVRLGYGQYMYNTADYTGGGYDRGHMEPSADQTKTDGENARTFFLTNFLPQKHGLNAGPWESLENALRDSVKAGREAYVIAGGIFTNGVGLGTINNAGKIAIPDSTWKIVVLMPAGTGLGDVTSASDVNVLAVNMPNVDAPGTNDWTAFKTTVAKLQKSTGYDFLAALPDPIECKVEADDCAPTARIVGATTGNEGQSLNFSGATSSDPDAGDVLSYQWSVNGQSVGIQPALAHVFADNGTYVVRLIVSDLAGKADTATTSVTIANVAPTTTLTGVTSLSISSGQSVTLTGAFGDPGSDSPWQYLIDWKDGATTSGSFTSVGSTSFTHQYLAAGSYTVPFTVTDKDGSATTSTVVITVGRVAVDGEASPSVIEVNENGIANISVRLTSPNIDVSSIDIATVRIAGVAAERGTVDQGGRRLSLDFTRRALIDAGALAADSTELVLTAALTNGMQIVSHIPVSMR